MKYKQKQIKHKRSQTSRSKVKNLLIVKTFFQKLLIKMEVNITKNKYFLFCSSFLSIYFIHTNQCTKMWCKWEYISIKLRIYSYLLNKSLRENFIFCVVNVIGFTAESCKFFFKPNCQSVEYFTSINTWHRLVSSLLFRN